MNQLIVKDLNNLLDTFKDNLTKSKMLTFKLNPLCTLVIKPRARHLSKTVSLKEHITMLKKSKNTLFNSMPSCFKVDLDTLELKISPKVGTKIYMKDVLSIGSALAGFKNINRCHKIIRPRTKPKDSETPLIPSVATNKQEFKFDLKIAGQIFSTKFSIISDRTAKKSIYRPNNNIKRSKNFNTNCFIYGSAPKVKKILSAVNVAITKKKNKMKNFRYALKSGRLAPIKIALQFVDLNVILNPIRV